MARDEAIMIIDVGSVVVGEHRRPIDDAAVKKLAASIKEIGLQHPITVRVVDDGHLLVAGHHRLLAAQAAGIISIPANVVRWTSDKARMWEISENLHRAELTKLERSEQIEEWRLLKSKTNGEIPHLRPGQPSKGISETAAEFGIDRKDVRDAGKVASISDEAKHAAREAGLDDNQSALLKVAAAPAAEQVARVHQLTEIPAPKTWDEVEAEQKRKLMQAWNASSPAVQKWFSEEIVDQPVMDRRFGT